MNQWAGHLPNSQIKESLERKGIATPGYYKISTLKKVKAFNHKVMKFKSVAISL